MTRRAADISTVSCPLLPRERYLVDEMKTKVGLASDADLVRVALYRFAVWNELDIDTSLFAVRGGPKYKHRGFAGRKRVA